MVKKRTIGININNNQMQTMQHAWYGVKLTSRLVMVQKALSCLIFDGIKQYAVTSTQVIQRISEQDKIAIELTKFSNAGSIRITHCIYIVRLPFIQAPDESKLCRRHVTTLIICGHVPALGARVAMPWPCHAVAVASLAPGTWSRGNLSSGCDTCPRTHSGWCKWAHLTGF